MDNEIISAKLDVVFKTLFVNNQNLLKVFVADVLDFDINTITDFHIKNTELMPETLDGKFSRLDLNMVVDNSLINIEIQVNNQRDYSDRSLFYWAKLFTSELKKGDEYFALKRAITINILDFVMFDGDNYHTEVVPMIKESGKVFSDKMSLHFFELKKLGDKINVNDRKNLWFHFINANSKEEFDMLKETKVPEISEAVDVIIDMGKSRELREIARKREEELHERASMLGSARAEGIAEGIAQGILKGRAEGEASGIDKMIEKLRLSGMTEEQISVILAM